MGALPVDTDKRHKQEHFEAHIIVLRDFFSVRELQNVSDSRLVNKVDWGGAPQAILNQALRL